MGSCTSKESEGQRLGTQAQRTQHPVNTEKNKNEPKKKTNKAPVQVIPSSKGHTLSEGTEGSEKEDPRVAARKAAEQRLAQQSAKSGTLGKKLDRERGQSANKHLQKESQQRLKEKEDDKFIYD